MSLSRVFTENSPYIYMIFQGILHGSKFKNKVLKMSWYIPKPELTRSSSHVSADSDLDTEVRNDSNDQKTKH